MAKIVDEMHADPTAFAERVRNDASLAQFVDDEGLSLLHRAFVYPTVTRALLDAGADPNKRNRKGDTPVQVAAKWVASESLKMLKEAGGDVSSIDSEGRTPLDWAEARGRDDVARMLRGEPEPQTLYERVINRVDEPKERARGLPVKHSIGVAVVAALIVYVAWAILRQSLNDRRVTAELAREAVHVDGVIVKHVLVTVGSKRVSRYRPYVAYKAVDGFTYHRLADHGFDLKDLRPVGTPMDVVYVRSRPEAARVIGLDGDEWVAGAVIGFLGMLLTLAGMIIGTLFGFFFDRRSIEHEPENKGQ